LQEIFSIDFRWVIVSTALLALVGPGDIWLGMVLVTLSAIMFASGENLIAAFCRR
jgi:UMF1 family MFS transporter